ncbi:MAG TPA: glycerate kinase [Nitrospiria bacterium]|nr:glycerate kinase [Nitrospiria bacterium]
MQGDVRLLLQAALRAADPAAAVDRSLRLERSRLVVTDQRDNRPEEFVYAVDRIRRLIVIGAGKAAPAMAAAVESVIGSRITCGFVVTKGRRFKTLKRVRICGAGHPIPDRAGRAAAARMVDLVTGLDPDDLVLFLLSGGASALLPFPVEGVTLQDKRRITDELLRAGATIEELNTVRKHLSRLKGGQLAARCRPARVVSLILSDVIGSPLEAIGSGPTAPDSTRFDDAITVLRKYRLWPGAPRAVKRYLEAGRRGSRPETPKPGDPLFQRVRNVVIGDNRTAVGAASAQARALGMNVAVLTTQLQGEAREAAKLFGALARQVSETGMPVTRPACLLAGGELTVTVTGRGKGGRCQEMALAAVKEIAGVYATTLAAFGTDGTDGPTDAAGAVVDDTTLRLAARRGLDPDRFLARNDSYHFFKKAGGLIRTGPTGTNVNDLYLLLLHEKGGS